MIHATQLLQRMRDDDPSTGHRPRVTLAYYKASGERIVIRQARLLRYDEENETILVSVPGGNRTLRLWAIVACDGEEVYL